MRELKHSRLCWRCSWSSGGLIANNLGFCDSLHAQRGTSAMMEHYIANLVVRVAAGALACNRPACNEIISKTDFVSPAV